MSDLDGKVALVTGSGGIRGLGRGIALDLARQGADICLTDADLAPEDRPPGEAGTGWRSIESVAEEVQALGRRSYTQYCDLSKPSEIEDLVRGAVGAFGHIDILVNNARAIIGRDTVPITELPLEVFEHLMAVNCTAAFLLMKHVGNEMIRQGNGGRIINIGSTFTHEAYPGTTAYSASKFATHAMTQAAALDLAKHQITVNVVCPGVIDSGRRNYSHESRAKAQGVSVDEIQAHFIEEATKRVPLGRVLVPEDIAPVVTFLASDKAAMVTGQAYNVSGGAFF